MEKTMKAIVIQPSAAPAASDVQTWLDTMSHEMRMAHCQAEADEFTDFRALPKGTDAANVSAIVEANLTLNAEHRKLVVPSAAPMGETYNSAYRSHYAELRRERLASGGKLPSDPGTPRPSWARGGPLTFRERTLRADALAAALAA
jgi:hypothetical protein